MRKTGIALTLTSALVMAVGLAGCGGGGGGNDNPGGGAPTRSQARTAAVTAVGGIRGIASRVAIGGGGRAVSRAKNAKQATRQAGFLPFDEDYGLWYTIVQGDTANSYRFVYFSDPNGNQPAGEAILTLVGNFDSNFEPTSLPASYIYSYNIFGGWEPTVGSMTLSLNSTTNVEVEADYEDLLSGERTTLDLTLNPATGATSGSMAFEDQQERFEMHNINYRETLQGSVISADVFSNGVNFGRLTLNADDSGSLDIPSDEGTVRVAWQANGAGSITYPDGSVEHITSFDSI